MAVMEKKEIREKLVFLVALGCQERKETWGSLVSRVSLGLLGKRG